MIISIVFIIVGFIFLIKGADFLVDGASNVAKIFHIPEIVIGLTIISIGTSMPELFISTTSAIEGYSDMAVGNIIGSNIVNLLFILGVSAMLSPIVVQKSTKKFDIPICLIITIIFMIICNTGKAITRTEGLILIGLFILFIMYTIYTAIKTKVNTEENLVDGNKSILKNIFLLILGIISLKIGGDITVDHSVNVAKYFNLSEKVIGVTILAIGTSLPELVTSVSAAIKGKSDIAIGNILGSNIFNMLLIIGVASIIQPITYNVNYNKDILILINGLLLLPLFTMIYPKNKIGKFNGAIYLFIYVEYIISLFIKWLLSYIY